MMPRTEKKGRLKKPQMIYPWCRKLFITYWWQHEDFFNDHFQEMWEIVEEKFVFIGCDPANLTWFGYKTSYYDGHTCSWISLFGLSIGWGYTYDSQSLKDIEDVAV